MANFLVQVSMWAVLLFVTSHLGSFAARDLPGELGTSMQSLKNDALSDVPEQSGSFTNHEVTSYFRKALPGVVMPEGLSKLVSPLPSSTVHQLVERIKAGELDSGESLGAALCSSAALLCGDHSELVGSESDMEKLENHTNPAEFTALNWADSSSLFLETQLMSGKGYEVPASVFAQSASHRKPFLPRPLARLLEHLANQGLGKLLRRLRIKKGTHMAARMRSNLRFCKSMSLGLPARTRGACVSSLEDLADLAADMLGKRGSGHARKVMLLGSSDTGSSSNGQDMFRVLKVDHRFVNAAGASDYLACHHMTAPFALEFCENVPATKLYSVSLESMSVKGRTISALALCHMDTSNWDSALDVFKALGTTPGRSGVCQWRKTGSFTFVVTN